MEASSLSPQTHKPHQRLIDRWLKKRLPASKHHTLNQRSIFIFPSRYGLAYLFVALFLFTLGTNYQNNLILLLSFCLIGFFVTSILYSFANLSGLTIKSSHHETSYTQDIYANDMALLPIYLSDCLNRNALVFAFAKHPRTLLSLAQAQEKVLVAFKATQRGWQNPGRLTIESYFPLGLLRCWTHLDMAIEVLVFPQPQESFIPLLPRQIQQQEPSSKSDEMIDFAGIREHVQGESLSRISWKHVARNQQKLVSKHFTDAEQDPQWLSIHQIAERDKEKKLSLLAFAVNDYSRQNVLFGLELDQTSIAPSSGDAHRIACLTALALC